MSCGSAQLYREHSCTAHLRAVPEGDEDLRGSGGEEVGPRKGDTVQGVEENHWFLVFVAKA